MDHDGATEEMLVNGTTAIAMQSSVSGQAIVGAVTVAGREAAIAFGSPDSAPVASIHSPGGSTVAIEGDLVVGGDLAVRGDASSLGTVVPVTPGVSIPPVTALSLTADGTAEPGWGMDLQPSSPGPDASGAVLVPQGGGKLAVAAFSTPSGAAVGLVRVDASDRASMVSGAVPLSPAVQWSHVSADAAMDGRIAVISYTVKGTGAPRFAIARTSDDGSTASIAVSVSAKSFGEAIETRQEASAIAVVRGSDRFVVVQATATGAVAFSGSVSGTPSSPSFVSSVSPLTALATGRVALPTIISVNPTAMLSTLFLVPIGQTQLMMLTLSDDQQQVETAVADTLPTSSTSRDAAVARVDDSLALLAYRVQEQGYAVRLSAVIVGTADRPGLRLVPPVAVHPGTADVSALRLSLAVARGGGGGDAAAGAGESPFLATCGSGCARRGRFALAFRDGAAVARVVDGIVAANGSALVLGTAGVIGMPGVSTEVAVAALPSASADSILVLSKALSSPACATGVGIMRAGPIVAGVSRAASAPASGGSFGVATAMAARPSSDADAAVYSLGDESAGDGRPDGFPTLQHVVAMVSSGAVALDAAGSAGSVFEDHGMAQEGPLVAGAAYGAARDGSIVAYGASQGADSLQLVGVAVARSRLGLLPSAFLSGANLGIIASSGAEQPGAPEAALSGGGRSGAGVPPGTVITWAGDVSDATRIPVGWLLCDGRSLGKDNFPALFAVIGCAFSNDTDCASGGPTFRLPSTHGRTIVGTTLAGRPSDWLAGDLDWGSTGGKASHMMSGDEVGKHTHSFVRLKGMADRSRVGGVYFFGGAKMALETAETADNAGTQKPLDRVQPYVAIAMLIKA